jgi:hypothetical protein
MTTVMYDYLFNFLDEAAAKLALSDYVEEGGHWDDSKVLPVKIVTQEMVFDAQTETITTPELHFPGYWIAVASTQISDDLYNIAECQQETLRPGVLTPFSETILRTKLTTEQYGNFIRVTPIFAGALYQWGA